MSHATTPTSLCATVPVSWLTLERYHLDELSADQRQRVDTHLQGCDACRGCLAQIRDEATELPPLVSPVDPTPQPPSWREAWRRSWPAWRRMFWGLAGAAAAALLVLGLRLLDGSQTIDGLDPQAAGAIRFKGGELAMALVRQRGGVVEHAPSSFGPGDRFKVLVTCAPGTRWSGELLVAQGDELDFPLAPATALACGNRQPLAGAFQITGDGPVTVCLVVAPDGDPPDRQRLRRRGLDGLPVGRATCVRLRPLTRED